jgi:hypothetical protein
MPVLKIGLLAVSSLLWLVGLADQLHSIETAATYLGISALLVALVAL